MPRTFGRDDEKAKFETLFVRCKTFAENLANEGDDDDGVCVTKESSMEFMSDFEDLRRETAETRGENEKTRRKRKVYSLAVQVYNCARKSMRNEYRSLQRASEAPRP